jgi:hydrogenase maturation protease
MAASARKRRVVVIGWGNPCRGDDALGPMLVEGLEGLAAASPQWPELHLVVAHQLQPEHALELNGRDVAVFVDAAVGLPGPYAFRPLRPAARLPWSTHGLESSELLAVAWQAFGQPPPRAYLLEIGGISFELDCPLSAAAERGLGLATGFLVRLLGDPREMGEQNLERGEMQPLS